MSGVTLKLRLDDPRHVRALHALTGALIEDADVESAVLDEVIERLDRVEARAEMVAQPVAEGSPQEQIDADEEGEPAPVAYTADPDAPGPDGWSAREDLALLEGLAPRDDDLRAEPEPQLQEAQAARPGEPLPAAGAAQGHRRAGEGRSPGAGSLRGGGVTRVEEIKRQQQHNRDVVARDWGRRDKREIAAELGISVPAVVSTAQRLRRWANE